MKLHFLGANRQVTGSCYLLEAAGRRILIDHGMYQERCCLERNWNPFPLPADRIDYALLTHAHLDHCGLLPRLRRQGFDGDVLTTAPSIELARIVLEDSAEIQEEDVATKRRRHEKEGRKGPHPLVPLYTRDDVASALRLLRSRSYNKTFELGHGIEVRFRDAGHILGSAIIEIEVEEQGRKRTVVFSGDLGQFDSPLVENPAIVPAADYIVMESTYGDRDHEQSGEIEANLGRIVDQTVERGGNLIVPTFAIDRAQDLLYYFSRLANRQASSRIGVYLDSPMAIDVTRVYKQYAYLLDGETRDLLERGEHPFQFRGLHLVRNREESKRLNSMDGSIAILAGSGMCTGGRVKHHLRRNIERAESTILFVGYQAEDTLGRQILDGARKVRIHGEFYRVRANVERLFGLSAHADRAGLMRWLGYFRDPPQRLFLTHGETSAAESLAGRASEQLGWQVTVPHYRDVVEL